MSTNDHTTALARVPEGQLHPLVQEALVHGGLDADNLGKLLDLQQRHQADVARRQYTAALVELKRDLPAVLKRDVLVKFTPKSGNMVVYRHTSLACAVDAVVTHLQRHGFSHSWHPAIQDDGRIVSVTCRLTHEAGHVEEVTLSAPPDSSGLKSPAQGIASAVTLLSRYTLLSLLGIATADHVEDGDEKTVDHERNLKAVASLRQAGVSLDAAEARVGGAKVHEWTAEHLQILREWHHEIKGRDKPQRAGGEVTREDVDALFERVVPHLEALDDEGQALWQEASLAYDDEDLEKAIERLGRIVLPDEAGA